MSRHGEPQNSSNARAMVVRSCEQYGPISGAGIGYWWECTADEADGFDAVRTGRSELTANDIGKTVGIYGESSGYSRSTHYYRDVEHPLYGLGIAVSCIGFFAVLGFLGGAFMRLVPQSIRLDADHKRAERLREQYRREGRL